MYVVGSASESTYAIVNEWFPQVPAGGISARAVLQLLPELQLMDVLDIIVILPLAFV
jgi:hypothetical protein